MLVAGFSGRSALLRGARLRTDSPEGSIGNQTAFSTACCAHPCRPLPATGFLQQVFERGHKAAPRIFEVKRDEALGLSNGCVATTLTMIPPRTLQVLLGEQNPQRVRRNNFPSEQIPQWFLLPLENLSASKSPGAAGGVGKVETLPSSPSALPEGAMR